MTWTSKSVGRDSVVRQVIHTPKEKPYKLSVFWKNDSKKHSKLLNDELNNSRNGFTLIQWFIYMKV